MSNNGTIVGSPTFPTAASLSGSRGASNFGRCLFTDGTAHVLLPAGGPSAKAAGDSWAVRVRFLCTFNGFAVLASDNSAAGRAWFLGVSDNGQVLAMAGNPSILVGEGGKANDGAWHVAALSVNGATGVCTLSLDGVVIATQTVSAPSPGSGGNPDGLISGYLGNYFFPGAIGQFEYYDYDAFPAAWAVPTTPTGNNVSGLIALYHFNGGATDSKGTADDASTAAPVGSLAQTFTKQVVCKGDSLTFGANATTGQGTATGTSYPGVLKASLGPTWLVANLGISGEQVATMIANFATESARQYDDSVAVHWVVIEGLTNDIGSTTDSASVLVGRLSTLCGLWRGVGFKIAVTTVPHCDFATVGVAAGTYPRQGSAAFNPVADGVNAIIRSTWAQFADKLADYAADPAFADETNATYRAADRVHYTDAGYAVMAGYVQAAIQTSLAASGTPTVSLPSTLTLSATGLTLNGSTGAYTLSNGTLAGVVPSSNGSSAVLSLTPATAGTLTITVGGVTSNALTVVPAPSPLPAKVLAGESYVQNGVTYAGTLAIGLTTTQATQLATVAAEIAKVPRAGAGSFTHTRTAGGANADTVTITAGN